jgi:hypothetical protein
MSDRLYTVTAPTAAIGEVQDVEVVDGSGEEVWGAGADVLDGEGEPTGIVQWGWWEFQWLGARGVDTLNAILALSAMGVGATWQDVD